MYEFFEHTADLGLRVRAADRGALFVDAARGLFSLIVANLDAVRSVEMVEIAAPGVEDDLLLFDWLNELLFLCETRRVLFCEFEIDFDSTGLKGRARGEPLDPSRHVLDHEVKAITYHALKVEHNADGWLAEVIVDI